MTEAGRLSVTLDGLELDSSRARAIWKKFSAYMEEHRNDFAGFAAQEGFAHAEVQTRLGRAYLLLSKAGGGTAKTKQGGRRAH